MQSLWKMDCRYFYLNHKAILNCSNACAGAAPRQGTPNLSMGSRTVDQVPSSPCGNTLWHESPYRVTRDCVTFPGQAKWHRASTHWHLFCEKNSCSSKMLMEVDLGGPRHSGPCWCCQDPNMCLFCHFCTKLFMGLNLQVLTELFVYGKVAPILGVHLVLQGLSL